MTDIRREYESRHLWMILACGESPYLEACIRSLLGQSMKSRICISTSQENERISGLAKRYRIPVVVNNGAHGITQDWNFAMGQADARYVTLAHQDDIYEKHYAERAVRALDRAADPLIYFSDYYEIRGHERVLTNRNLRIKRLMLLPLCIRRLQSSRFVRRRILSFGSPVCCPAVTYVKEALPSPLFDDSFRVAQDWETWERLSSLKGAFVFDPKPLMGHRIHEGSTTTELIADETRSREERKVLLRFWPKPVAGVIEHFYKKGQDSNRM